MKVVLEGAVYDRDFIGDILVINRDDIVNLSTMSRSYKIEMELKKTNRAHFRLAVPLRYTLPCRT
ncbi:hypothetical protein RCO48_33385 [Peribacillus frigoritolerans]|nr:hypothetical protein [Peribacillus frigoritolerans]